MQEIKIALIAHDNKKADMVAFILKRLDFFRRPEISLIATGTTGTHIINSGLSVERVNSGPMGGDAQIASRMVEGEIDAVIFFIDPLDSHPHEVDVHMLLRLCNVHNIMLATNYETARAIIEHLEKKILDGDK